MLNEVTYPIIFGHRGASAYAPENTLAAFELALRQEADAIELDAKLSRDGHVVTFHDQTLDRTTEGSGPLRKKSLAELRKLDAGSHFDVAFSGEPIPTLDEVFKAVGKLTYINVELTNYASPFDNLPYKVAELVKKHKLSRRIIFSSFSWITLYRIHRLLPDIPLGLLAESGWRGWRSRSWLGRFLPYQSLNPEAKDVTPDLVNNAHQRGKRVFVYTVNTETEMRRLFELGVDGIFTDDPVLARNVRQTVLRKEKNGNITR
jgi:glycerophosphoryl diester phosphodiesterase